MPILTDGKPYFQPMSNMHVNFHSLFFFNRPTTFDLNIFMLFNIVPILPSNCR